MGKFSQFDFFVAQMGKGHEHFLPHGLRTEQVRTLRQVANAQALHAIDRPRAWVFGANQDSQEGGFASAIWPHQGDSRPMRNIGGDVAEYIVGSKGFSGAFSS